MKKIINGKVYNTETSELILEWWNGRGTNDFTHRSKDLYRTKKGAWFLHHIGGAMTDMARSCGSNSWTGSEDIEPIGESDVLAFLETHGGEEVLEKYFADKIEEA